MRRVVAALAVCWVLGGGVALAEPPTRPTFGDGQQSKRAPIQAPKDRPAQGAPYNWRQMAYAGVIMVIMLGGVLYLIRRSSRDKRS